METRWRPVPLVVWITTLALTLDARQQARFVRLCTGLLFARGRRTVTSWLYAMKTRCTLLVLAATLPVSAAGRDPGDGDLKKS